MSRVDMLSMAHRMAKEAWASDAEQRAQGEVALPLWMLLYLLDRIERQESELSHMRQALDTAARLVGK